MLANRRSALALMDKLADSLSQNVREEGAPIPQKAGGGHPGAGPLLRLPRGGGGAPPRKRPVPGGEKLRLGGRFRLGEVHLAESGLWRATAATPGKSSTTAGSSPPSAPQSLYELVSLVEQNVFVFNSTLRDKHHHVRDFPPQQVQRAEELSGLAPIIQEKGEGYLCGGERLGALRRPAPAGVHRPVSAAAHPPCFWWTRPPLPWIRRQPSASPAPFWIWRASPGWWSPTPWTRRSSAGTTASWCCTTAAWWRPAQFQELMDRKGLFYSLYTVAQ